MFFDTKIVIPNIVAAYKIQYSPASILILFWFACSIHSVICLFPLLIIIMEHLNSTMYSDYIPILCFSKLFDVVHVH